VRLNRVLFWSVWIAGGAITVVHALQPDRFALRTPTSTAVLETAAACGAMLLSAMTYGRWRQRKLWSDLVTTYAFSMLAAGNLLFALLPLVANPDSIQPGIRVAAFLCGAAAAGLFAIASLVPERPAERARPDLPILLLSVTALVGGIAVTGWFFRDSLTGLTGTPSTEAAGRSGGDIVSVVQVLCALAFALASVRFAQRGRRRGDAFYAWLAVTAALWALARLNYAITPSDQVAQLGVADWLRLAAYLVAVIAVAAELNGYWHRLADTAVLEERRRIARDMHDGLAQELAFIATQTRGLGTPDTDPARAQMVARAAERALDESRRAIAALTRPVDEPLDVALAQQAEELSGRLGVRVQLDLTPCGAVGNDTREALLRIAREAITNAGRHGRPTKISVHLSNHDGITMRVSDDGRGFRPDDPKVFAGDRWGVAGMKERAEALGGRFALESRPYRGTRVEVWVP
jgi:signal transduction histidine kinase